MTVSRANNVRTLHETFVHEVMGSNTNNAKTLHESLVDEVTGSHANKVKMLHETFFDEVTDSNPVHGFLGRVVDLALYETKVLGSKPPPGGLSKNPD